MEQTSVVPTFFHLEGVNIAELGIKPCCQKKGGIKT
jgi:hypothetical protein